MRIISFSYWLLFSLCFCGNLSAQKYLVQTHSLTTNMEGESFPPIHAMTQDQHGFMWFATDEGLGRYDGIKLKLYPQFSQQIDFRNVRFLFHVTDSTFLVTEQKSAYTSNPKYIKIVNLKNGHVKTLRKKNSDTWKVMDLGKQVIKQTEDGTIWIAETTALWQYKNDSLLQIPLNLGDKTISNILPLSSHQVWLSIAHIKTSKKEVQSYLVNSKGDIVDQSPIYTSYIRNIGLQLQRINAANNLIYSVYSDKVDDNNNRFVVNTNYQKAPKEAPVTFRFDNGKVYRHILYHPGTKQYWCANNKTANYFDIFDQNGHFLQSSGFIDNFSAIALKKGFIDQQNGLWWLEKSFIKRVQLVKNNFQVYLNKQKADKQKKISCRQLIELENGDIIVNSSEGTYHIDTNGQATLILKGVYNLKENAIGQSKFALLLEGKDSLWITDSRSNILLYNLQTGVYKQFTYAQQEKFVRKHWSIHRDKRGKLWVGQQNGLSFLNEEKGYLEHYQRYNDFQELAQQSIYHIHENEAGIWLATQLGLYLLDPDKGIKRRICKECNSKLPHNIITHIHEDSEGIFWLASRGGGLISWDPKTDSVAQFTTQKNLPSNTVYAIYADDFGYLWVSSNNGLIRFNKTSHEISRYSEYHGIHEREFNTISHYKSKDGTIYFGGVDGFLRFHPKDFPTENKTRLSITEIKAYDIDNNTFKDYMPFYEERQTLELPAGQILGYIDLTLFDYSKAQQNIYTYKIDGIHESWQQNYSGRIHLAGIPYGNYKLSIKAKGTSQVWTEAQEINLTVTPPFYLTWPFLVAAFVCFALILWVFIHWWTNRLRRRQKELEGMVQERTQTLEQQAAQLAEQAEKLKSVDKLKSRFFANISHELRTPLTLILGPLYHILENTAEFSKQKIVSQLGTMQRNGESLLYLVEEILDLSKIDANKLELNERRVNIIAFFRNIHYRFLPQAENKQVTLEREFDFLPGLELKLDDDKLEKVIVNLLSNALKFTPAEGQIRLSAKVQKNLLKLEVMDSGIGISKEDLPNIFERFFQSTDPDKKATGGTGIGLSFVKELVELMNGNITVKSTLGKGTVFRLSIPVQVEQIEAPKPVPVLPVTDRPEIEEAIPLPVKGAKILLAEDTTDMRQFLSELLQSNYQVTAVKNGKEALDHLAQTEEIPDLIISDVMMPKMDGFELANHLKNEPKYQKTPLIMLTARAAEQDKIKGLRIGVDDYITKPFSSNELQLRIANLLYNAKARLTEQGPSPEGNNESDNNTTTINKRDERWLVELEKAVKDRIDEVNLTAEDLAAVMMVSYSTFRRKVKKLVGISPAKYLRAVRMQVARELLEQGKCSSLIEVSQWVGFDSPYYFSELFEKEYGRKVTDYL